jgi:hypothetical protein
MLVVVPATKRRCVASLALNMEGMEHTVVLMENDYAYSDTLVHLWKSKQDFVILEHDVVPWPGGIQALFDCKEPWCGYHYPFAPKTIRGALGCAKFSGELTTAHSDLWTEWVNLKWNQIDGSMFPAVIKSTGLQWFHRHIPDFAHIK